MATKAYQLPPLVRLTDETDFGLWPTPNTMDSMAPRSDEAFARAKKIGGCSNLKDWITRPHLWPTPKAADAERGGRGDLLAWARGYENKHYPTPTANRRSGLQSHGVNVVTGGLNPTWVEWLMGYETGWTVCEPSATPSSRKSRKSSAERS